MSRAIPTEDVIASIPLARAGEYELSTIETKKLRSLIYKMNKNHVHGWRWRTLREGNFLLVWRIK